MPKNRILSWRKQRCQESFPTLNPSSRKAFNHRGVNNKGVDLLMFPQHPVKKVRGRRRGIRGAVDLMIGVRAGDDKRHTFG